MTLEQRLRSFLDWMSGRTLPGFMTHTEENYSEDYSPLKEVLLDIASKIKVAVRDGNVLLYEENEKEYREYFETINGHLSQEEYDHLFDELVATGLDGISAQTMAVNELWKHPAHRYFLGVAVQLVHPQTGKILYLIGDARHSRGRRPFVTAEEISMLKSSFQDPWEYVNNRESKHVQTNIRNHGGAG